MRDLPESVDWREKGVVSDPKNQVWLTIQLRALHCAFFTVHVNCIRPSKLPIDLRCNIPNTEI